MTLYKIHNHRIQLIQRKKWKVRAVLKNIQLLIINTDAILKMLLNQIRRLLSGSQLPGLWSAYYLLTQYTSKEAQRNLISHYGILIQLPPLISLFKLLSIKLLGQNGNNIREKARTK